MGGRRAKSMGGRGMEVIGGDKTTGAGRRREEAAVDE